MKAILSLFDVFVEAFYYYYNLIKKKNPARIGGLGFTTSKIPTYPKYFKPTAHNEGIKFLCHSYIMYV